MMDLHVGYSLGHGAQSATLGCKLELRLNISAPLEADLFCNWKPCSWPLK